MARLTPNTQWQNALVLMCGVVLAAASVAALYWAQLVFVPIALAVLLMFLLTPPVRWLERKGLGRSPAVALVMVLTIFAVGEFGYLITRQIGSLAEELPDYSANVQRKIHALRTMSGSWDRVQQMFADIAAPVDAPKGAILPPNDPTTVVVRPEAGWMARWPHFLGSAAEVGAGAALVFVLTLFGLLKREDLRNRFLRLIGHRRLAFTTKAVDEAGERVSRYLMMQAMVNIGYGLALAIGLGIIGVKYALLWGFIAAVLRYVPYLGAWIAVMFPLVVSVATSETWFDPLATLGVFIALELVTYNLVEPLLFKRSMGVSEVAQLVSAAFWGFLWGPVGLILSAPLTVCLLVAGKYVPQLSFLDVMLGDDPPLEPAVSLYQRLLAWDEDDAAQLVAEQIKATSAEAVYDDLLVPALSFVKRDRIRDEITDEDEKFILRATRELVDDLTPIAEIGVLKNRPKILACPAFDQADSLALEMLQKLMAAEPWHFERVQTESLVAEVVERAIASKAQVICIGSVPPGGLAHTRYLCKRLRSQLPAAKIFVGRWGRKANEDSEKQLLEAGADAVSSSLLATRNQLNAWLPIFAQSDARDKTVAAERLTIAGAPPELAAV